MRFGQHPTVPLEGAHAACPNCGAHLESIERDPLESFRCPHCRAKLAAAGGQIEHYKLLAIAGRGGMGVVYRAYDPGLDREVALKLLRKDKSADTNLVEQLETEAQITATINDPNVVRVFATGTDHGRFFIAMEMVKHGSLEDLITRQGRIAELHALEIGIQIASGLRAALLRGLIHRDVKPGNILFADADTAKIVDFGLAITLEQAKEAAGEIWGTPYYLAPEKLEGEPEDFRSDMYSLGASLFHALAGRPPFEDKNLTAVVLKRLKSQPVSLQTFAPHISNATAFIINQTLARYPDDRFLSYDELIHSLTYARDELLASGDGAKPRTRMVIEGEEDQRAWGFAVLGMIAVAVLVLLAGFVWRDTIFGTGKTAPPVASTESQPETGQKTPFEEACREISGDPATAAVAFRKIAESHPAQPAENWAVLLEGTAEFLAGRSTEARQVFKKLSEGPPFSTKAEDRALADFFSETARAMAAETPIPVSKAATFRADNHEAIGLLLAGMQHLYGPTPDEGLSLLRKFRVATPTESAPWITDLHVLATNLITQRTELQSAVDRFHASQAVNEKIAIMNDLRKIASSDALARSIVHAMEPAFAAIGRSPTEGPRLGVYRITNRASGKSLDVKDYSLANGAGATISEYSNAPNQQWKILPAADGYYYLLVRHSGKALDVSDASTQEGAPVTQWTFNYAIAQRWRIERVGDYFRLMAVCSGKALSVEHAATSDGARIVQRSFSGAADQQWELVPTNPTGIVANGVYKLVNRKSGKAANVQAQNTADGATVIQSQSLGQPNERWVVEQLEDGYYKITAQHSAKCLDVANASTQEGAHVQQWSWNGFDAQRWKVRAVEGSWRRLVAKCSEKALSVENGVTTDNAILVQRTFSRAHDQQWEFVPIDNAAPAQGSR